MTEKNIWIYFLIIFRKLLAKSHTTIMYGECISSELQMLLLLKKIYSYKHTITYYFNTIKNLKKNVHIKAHTPTHTQNRTPSRTENPSQPQKIQTHPSPKKHTPPAHDPPFAEVM